MFLKMSFEALNWTSHMIALVGVLLLCLPTFWMAKLLRRFEPHQKIDSARVKKVRMFDNGNVREASPAEAERLVSWYNEAAFIQKREYENPRAGTEGIAIELDNGEEILIVPRDGDFDIIRRRADRPIVTYWARHAELGDFLVKL